MLWAECVVAIDSALREVTAAHVSKLHQPSLLHGNTIESQATLHLRRKKKTHCSKLFLFIYYKFKVETHCMVGWANDEVGKRWAALCEYLFSVRRYPDWAHTWGKDTSLAKPRWQYGLWATWHITCLSPGLFQSSSTFAIVHCHVWACGTRCLRPPTCMRLKFLWWIHSLFNF